MLRIDTLLDKTALLADIEVWGWGLPKIDGGGAFVAVCAYAFFYNKGMQAALLLL